MNIVNSKFRNDIQGFRALAFILVFVFHINSYWLPGGFLGVDVFFVISGYLMTNIIVEGIQNNKFDYYEFLIKRIKRIVPAFYFFLVLTLFASWYFYLYRGILDFRGQIIRTALFISNISFSKGNNYFGSAFNENPLLHTWSLAIEMQFYFILPLLLLLFRKHVVKLLFLIIIVLTIYSSYQIYILDNKTSMYFSLIARFPEFLVGGIFSQIYRKNINLTRNYNNIIALASLMILLASCIFITEKTPFPGFIVLIPCVATAVLLSIENNSVSDFFSNKILVYIGELSYSLYLLHFPILAFIRYRNNFYTLSPLEIFIVCILTFSFAWLSYTLIENKFRHMKNLNFYKKIIPAYLLFFIFCWYVPAFARVKIIPKNYAIPFYGMKSHNVNNVEKFGNLQNKDSILLIGDSHALMLKPFFNEIGIKNGFSFYTLTCDTFAALPGVQIEDVSTLDVPRLEQSQKLIELTQKLVRENKYIFLCINGLKSPKSEYMAIEQLVATLRRNQHLILINTFPILDRSPIRINMSIVRTNPFKFSDSDNSENFERLKKISEKNINVHLYNINKGAIRKRLGFIDDTLAYYNRMHINTFASKKMAVEMNADFMIFFNAVKCLK